MTIWTYSATRDSNASIVPGNIRVPPEHFWAQQIVNAIRQLMADLKTFAGTVTNVLPLDGIQFPATQVPSSDPNTLDDYEEGTWTPVQTFGGATTGITYTTQEGFYTKIGRQVGLEGEVLLLNNGTATGNAQVTGMPFSAARDSAPMGKYISGFTGITAGGFLITNPGTGTLLQRHDTTTGSVASNETHFLDTARYFFGGTYSV